MLVICRQCGAENDARAKSCWLCGDAMTVTAAEPLLIAEAVEERPDKRSAPATVSNWTAWWYASVVILAVVFLAIVAGLWQQDRPLAWVLLLTAALALLITLAASATSAATGQSISPVVKLTIFISTAAVLAPLVTIAMLAFLVLSVIVSIFQFCTGGG